MHRTSQAGGSIAAPARAHRTGPRAPAGRDGLPSHPLVARELCVWLPMVFTAAKVLDSVPATSLISNLRATTGGSEPAGSRHIAPEASPDRYAPIRARFVSVTLLSSPESKTQWR